MSPTWSTWAALDAALVAAGHDLDALDPGALAIARVPAMAADIGSLPGYTVDVTDRDALVAVLVAVVETGDLAAMYARPAATTPPITDNERHDR